MENLRKLLPVLALLIGFGLVMATSSFTNSKLNESEFFFKFEGPSGEEGNLSNWRYVTGMDIPTCDNEIGGCKIKVSLAGVDEDLVHTYVLKNNVPVDHTNTPIEGGVIIETYNRE